MPPVDPPLSNAFETLHAAVQRADALEPHQREIRAIDTPAAGARHGALPQRRLDRFRTAEHRDGIFPACSPS